MGRVSAVGGDLTKFAVGDIAGVGIVGIVGIVGPGGLGQMGMEIAAEQGAEVYVCGTSLGKRKVAKRLGASDLIMSKDTDAMAEHAGSFDVILKTVAAPQDLDLPAFRGDSLARLSPGARGAI